MGGICLGGRNPKEAFVWEANIRRQRSSGGKNLGEAFFQEAKIQEAFIIRRQRFGRQTSLGGKNSGVKVPGRQLSGRQVSFSLFYTRYER